MYAKTEGCGGGVWGRGRGKEGRSGAPTTVGARKSRTASKQNKCTIARREEILHKDNSAAEEKDAETVVEGPGGGIGNDWS
jgi:hypothetical protein